MPNDNLPIPTTHNFFASVERTLSRFKVATTSLLRGSAVAGAILVAGAPGLAGCGQGFEPGQIGAATSAVLANGQSDWAQQQGQRNTWWAQYRGESWFQYTDCGSRGGCQGVDLFLKVYVRPADGADLNWKRVGVVYRAPGVANPQTTTGWYFTTHGDGYEEWHVKVHLATSSQGVISLNAWYQDGKGSTFYDDNNGELHAATWTNGWGAVQHLWGFTSVVVDATGVHGNISVRLADLDYDKHLELRWTTDGWRSSNSYVIGAGDNAWHWVEDYGSDHERWDINVNIPGDYTQFQYAILYRHGVVNGARTYDYWDSNNSNNYVVNR